MNLKSLLSRVKRLIFLLRNKGIRYTYSYIHFCIFWGTKSPPLINLLHWFTSYPSYIEIEVTTRCNMRCTMCEHTYWNEPIRDMSFEEFKGIVDQFPKLKWIGLTGIGQSFLNKDFLRMLEYVKAKAVYVELYNTFYFVDKKISEALIRIGVDRILVSLDGATKETYERIRIGSNFEKVIKNIKHFIWLKKKMDAHFPELDFHYIVTKANMREIPQYIEMVHSLGSKGSKIQFTMMLHEFEEIKDLFVKVPEEIIQRAEQKAKELEIQLIWNANVPKAKPPLSQCLEWIMPFIFVTGHVIPCCAGNEANRRDFQKETSLGNVFEKSFKEIWYGEKYKRFRRMLYKGEVPVQCENCPLYNTGGK